MKSITIIYRIPDGFDVSTLTHHEFASAFSWSNKMDECNGLKAALEIANDSTERFERELREENKLLRALLDEAADDIADWGSYASDYFKDKHDLPGCVAKYRLTPNAALTGAAKCD